MGRRPRLYTEGFIVNDAIIVLCSVTRFTSRVIPLITVSHFCVKFITRLKRKLCTWKLHVNSDEDGGCM